MSSSQEIQLKSSDNKVVIVDVRAAQRSKFITKMLGAGAVDSSSAENEVIIPVPDVRKAILQKVVDWCTQHKDDLDAGVVPGAGGAGEEGSKMEGSGTGTGEQSGESWEGTFWNVDLGTLFELTLAANILQVEELLSTSIAAVAGKIKENSVEELRKAFQILHNELAPDPEEEEQIKQENEVCTQTEK